jgi:outer membrane lipoprotein LolB
MRGAAFLAAVLLISGCAGRPAVTLPDISPWDARQEFLGNLDKWAFNGRIAVRADDDGFNGKLRYKRRDRDFDAVVSGPLGIGTVKLEGREGTLSFTDKHGVTTQFTNPETELKFRFGWEVPLESLRYWALGIPDPAQPADTVLNEDGQLASMAQGGWDIEVKRYRETGGELMPERLTVTKPGAKVTLVIDRWDFGEAL